MMALLSSGQGQYTVTLHAGLMDEFSVGNVWSLPSGHFVKLVQQVKKHGAWLVVRVDPRTKQELPDSSMLLSCNFMDAHARLCWSRSQWERKAV
jgi:hypothetical protein